MVGSLDIKICGLTTVPAIERAAARGATHLGFVHFAPSPRHLAVAAMAALRPAVPPTVALAVVLVDPDDVLLATIHEAVRPDLFQLHGRETPDRVSDVRQRFGVPVMKALSVGEAADLAAVAVYRSVADRILLDAKRPKSSALPGGNGVAFDWDLLADLEPGTPYMLSGGLGAENVGAAVARLAPAGIDASTGLESAPGVKDLGRIDAFFDALAARSAT